MNHTRESIRRIFAPWALVAWVALVGLAMIADHVERTAPVPQTQEQQP